MLDAYEFGVALNRLTDEIGKVYKDSQRDALYRYVARFNPSKEHWHRVIDHLIDTWEMARLPQAAHFRQALQSMGGGEGSVVPKSPCARCGGKGTLLFYEIRHGEVWDETVCGCGCDNSPPGIPTMQDLINAGSAPRQTQQFARFNGRNFSGSEPGQVRYRLELTLLDQKERGEPAPDEAPAEVPF